MKHARDDDSRPLIRPKLKQRASRSAIRPFEFRAKTAVENAPGPGARAANASGLGLLGREGSRRAAIFSLLGRGFRAPAMAQRRTERRRSQDALRGTLRPTND